MPEATNRERCKSGLDFEKEVFDLLSKNDIPYIGKKRYTIPVRNGTIRVEPDITIQNPLILISIKTSVRERWKGDTLYDRINGVKHVILVTKPENRPKACAEHYDKIFVLPEDETKLVDFLKSGELLTGWARWRELFRKGTQIT